MSDQLVSLIRTLVPVAVGAVLTWVARSFGFVLDENTSAEVTTAAVALTIAGYYAAVRALEARWPAFGVLLGTRKTPTYEERF